MIYFGGDNNLSEECVFALTEIRAVEAIKNKVHVLAQFDPSGRDVKTHRYEIFRKGGAPQTESKEKTNDLEGDKIPGWNLLEGNTGEPATLEDFIRWGLAEYPADHVMVVLAGHGSGSDDDFLLRDENPPDFLSIAELQGVFERLAAEKRTIDILGFDTCLMSMAEICHQLQRTSPYLQYIVSSEGFSPNTGWPYRQIFKRLTDDLSMGPDDLAKIIVEEYANFYVPYVIGDVSVDQSALVLEESPDLTAAIKALADKLSFLLERDFQKRLTVKRSHLLEGETLEIPTGPEYATPLQNALVLAHWDAQSYNGEVFVDLFDFCQRLIVRYTALEDHYEVSRVVTLCKELMAVIKDRVVLKTCYSGPAFQYSYGVSIYFPWSGIAPHYKNLSFADASGWLRFLDLYVKYTRRPYRKGAEFRLDIEDRATPPTNKGRDGRVESMRNPPGRFDPGDCIRKPVPETEAETANGYQPQPQQAQRKKPVAAKRGGKKKASKK